MTKQASLPTVPRKKTRGPRAAGDKRKTTILDAAERLFAERGFHGVSIREISEAAGIGTGHTWYHYRTKEDLFLAIFQRRIAALTEAREALLSNVLKEAGSKPPRLELVLEALIGPIVRSSRDPKLGGVHFARLIAHTLTSPESDLVQRVYEYFDPMVFRLQKAIAAALPNLSSKSLQWGYHFTVGAFIYTMANTGRLRRLSKGKCTTEDPDVVLQNIIPFVAAGLREFAAPNSVTIKKNGEIARPVRRRGVR